jgi:6-phosphogluconate dehydrogenase
MATTAPALQTAQFRVIGLGNMGENLALNVEDHGYRVALWNHKPDKAPGAPPGRRAEGGLVHHVQAHD